MHRRYPVLVGLVVVIAGAVWLLQIRTTQSIDSYATCAEAGRPILETDPPVCQSDNHNFIGPRAHTEAVATPAPAASQSFELLVHGDSRGNYPDRQEVIHTATDWQRYWGQVHAGLATQPPLLPVNFTTNTVIALSYGRKPTTGYDIKATSITSSSKGTSVDVVQTIPGEGCVVTASATNPYFIIRTTVLPEPVSFRTIVQKHHCS